MRKLTTSIISLSLFLSLILCNEGTKTYAIGNVDWQLLKENNDGKEWVDIGSIKKYKNNELSVLTKYFQNPNNTKPNGETNLYVMRINCSSREYKDISINGIPSFKPHWKSSNHDELIDIVIDKTCSENYS